MSLCSNANDVAPAPPVQLPLALRLRQMPLHLEHLWGHIWPWPVQKEYLRPKIVRSSVGGDVRTRQRFVVNGPAAITNLYVDLGLSQALISRNRYICLNLRTSSRHLWNDMTVSQSFLDRDFELKDG